MTEIKLYTLEEVADILKISRRTLYTYVKTGKLHAVKIGKHWRVSHDVMEAFISGEATNSNSINN